MKFLLYADYFGFMTEVRIRFIPFVCLLLFAASSCATVSRRRGGSEEVFNVSEAARIEDFVPQWRDLYTGLACSAGRIKVPRMEFWAIRIDLRDKNNEIIVNNAGTDTDSSRGSLPAITVSGFSAEYHCVAAMNGGPFSPVSAKSGEERLLTGVFISSGSLVSPPDSRYDSLVIYDDGYAGVLPQRELRGGIRYAIGGFYTVLDGGNLTERAVPVKKRHPRSAAAVSEDGFTLYLLVIDGRRPGSAGATEQEAGLLLRALGAEDGLLMDGGGSSALTVNLYGKIRTVNKPVHGGIIGLERAVATCIGVRRAERD